MLPYFSLVRQRGPACNMGSFTLAKLVLWPRLANDTQENGMSSSTEYLKYSMYGESVCSCNHWMFSQFTLSPSSVFFRFVMQESKGAKLRNCSGLMSMTWNGFLFATLLDQLVPLLRHKQFCRLWFWTLNNAKISVIRKIWMSESHKLVIDLLDACSLSDVHPHHCYFYISVLSPTWVTESR